MSLFGPAYPTLRQVIVNTKTGKAFAGVLWQRRRDYLVLRNVEMLQGRQRVPLEGELAVARDNVDFLQVL